LTIDDWGLQIDDWRIADCRSANCRLSIDECDCRLRFRIGVAFRGDGDDRAREMAAGSLSRRGKQPLRRRADGDGVDSGSPRVGGQSVGRPGWSCAGDE
jgi:hypothetical protein